MTDDPSALPPGFTLGVSTAAAQIEGAWDADGKGASIWDEWSHTPGRVERGETGDVACDSYHRFAEDLDLIRDARLDAYRFSISWPRVLPEGTGRANEAGLDFYDRVVDGCLQRGIEPWICLYHWDLPQALQDRGGWASRDVVGWFGDYAALMADRLGDRVKRWATFNEPSNPAVLGYVTGAHPPGIADRAQGAAAIHHINLSHIAAAELIRGRVADAQVGIILALNRFEPPTDDPADARAAAVADLVNHGAFLDPVLRGRYPDGLARPFADAPFGEDAEVIARAPGTIDWLGVNYYGPFFLGADPATGRTVPKPRPGRETTAIGWEVDAAGMTRWLRALRDQGFAKPLYVTENGFPLEDEAVEDGRVRDDRRVAYLRDHLRAALDARAEGVDVRGYFAWTLIDNFEWTFGWRPRFGLVHLDRGTLTRTPKDSYRWLAETARTRRVG